MKKVILLLTETQFTSLLDSINTLSAMVGTADENFNKTIKRDIKNIDKMLNTNGYKRKYN